MDFGIDRLIEMIEQRISRPVANAVLYVLTLAVLVVGLKTIGAFVIAAFTYIRGLFLYFHGAKAPQLTSGDALLVVTYIALIVLLWMVSIAGLAVIRRRYQKKLDAAVNAAKEILVTTEEEAKRILYRTEDDVAAIIKSTKETIAESKAVTDKSHADLHGLIEEIDRKLKELKERSGSSS